MKTRLFILLLLVSPYFYGCVNGGQDDVSKMKKLYKLERLPKLKQTDNVCEKMKDIEFIKYCLKNFDANHDGKLSMHEASAVRNIECDDVEDFSGIEYFSNLRTFEGVSDGNIDFRYNSELVSLDWDSNSFIERVDLRYNVNLEEFDVPDTKELLLPAFWKGDFDELVFYGDSLTLVLLPQNMPYIADYAFKDCISLKNIIVPDCVTKIGCGAFGDCKSLTSIALPDGLTEIGAAAFFRCESLTSITLPEELNIIEEETFMGCTGLENVTLPDGLVKIGKLAFGGCSGLASVTLPEGLTTIDEWAFGECSSLPFVVIPNSVTIINKCAFAHCSSLASVTLPEGLTTIEEYLFAMCNSLSDITIPNGVTKIGRQAFQECASLARVSLPKELIEIGDAAFYDCPKITSISLPDGLIEIGGIAFSGCTGLTSISIPENVTEISFSTFSNCTGLKHIILPVGITAVYNEPFIIPIDSYTFEAKTTQYTTFEGLSIGDTAFRQCPNLTDISIQTVTPPAIFTDNFFNPEFLFGIDHPTILYVPSGSERAYKNSDWAKYFEEIKTISAKAMNENTIPESLDNSISNDNSETVVETNNIGWLGTLNISRGPVYVRNPFVKKSTYGITIKQVRVTDTQTIVNLEYDNNTAIHDVNVSSSTHIITDNGTKLTLTKAEGIPITPPKNYLPPKDVILQFTLYFPALPEDTSKFDIIEETENGFEFCGVSLKPIKKLNNLFSKIKSHFKTEPDLASKATMRNNQTNS